MTDDTTLTLNKLESHLWETANILRGSPVDRTDWKSYILPLLFFKRICDVWDEERDDMIKLYGDDFLDEHRFQVPEGCHWNDVRETPANVGSAIATAMRGIERENQKHLYGVFGDAQWTNKDRLPDSLLKDLIEHFSALRLGNKAVRNDVIGDAYEYLIKKFADATNKKAGEFYTPRSVVRLMIDILAPQEGETVYDPACGTGGMLLAAVEHVHEAGGDHRTFFGRLFGQEKNLTTSSVARMNLLLHDVEDFQIERGDTLRSPVFTDPATEGLATFDVVIANPPFSLKNWGREIWESDPWGRAFAGLPTDKSGDFAWVQHMVKSMAPGKGRMAVVLPQGALFRSGVEGKIRKHLLQHDLIEAVIGLAPNLFYGTGLAACVLVLRMPKPAERAKKVLIVDASSLFRNDRAQNHLEPGHAAEILGWFTAFEDVEDRVRVVDLSEIEDEEWTLNISRYVMPPIGQDIPPLPEAVASFKAALARCREAEEALRREMTEGGVAQMSATITQPQLESYLWGAAEILRGLVDAGDYKQYIFPLVFFKRLSDVWDEDFARVLEEFGGNEELATAEANERFIIPEGAHWDDVREVPRDVGSALQAAMRDIEVANLGRLDRIFGDAPWTNRDRLSDYTLKNLLEHFSSERLSIARVPEDTLGDAYEFLIGKFADDGGSTAQEFYTNRTLVHLMAQMLKPDVGESIYDPTCGTGGMLLSALTEVKRSGGEHRTLRLYGQERNLMTASIARMNLVLHGIEDFDIQRGDTLANPIFTGGDRLRTFDVVLANPPYSIKQWNREAWTTDPWGRNFLGTPPQGRADYAFFQHILQSMDAQTGRCAILFPHGVLFRKEEAEMRRKLVEADLVECVLGLGPNLFFNSPMEACVVFCRSTKAAGRSGKILFIDAVNEVARERSYSFLKLEHQDRIRGAYERYEDEEGFAKVATLDEVAAKDYSLSIPLYLKRVVAKQANKDDRSLGQVWATWGKAGARVLGDMDTLVETLDELVSGEVANG